jgi:hypothetical protein
MPNEHLILSKLVDGEPMGLSGTYVDEPVKKSIKNLFKNLKILRVRPWRRGIVVIASCFQIPPGFKVLGLYSL